MSYLIKDTTKEERRKLVKNALGISIAGDTIPSKYVTNLIKEYINGNMELDIIKQKLIERYKNNE